MNSRSPQLQQGQHDLYETLMSSCVDYIAHSAVGEAEVCVTFAGLFESRPVVWFANIHCLTSDNGEQKPQYIEVQVNDPARPRISVGLPLTAINESDILKTIMMVRQYKQLRRGRHEFLGRGKIAE